MRVHTDTRAANTASSISARAFTVGPDIAFGAGQFSPDSQSGRQLLAHELTHVIQQSGTGQATGEVVARDPNTGTDDPNEPYPGAAKIRSRLADIDARLTAANAEYAEAFSKQDRGVPDLIALKKRVAAVRRERFIVETIEWNASLQSMDEKEVETQLEGAGPAASTEDGTLAYMNKMILGNPSGLELAEYLLLKRPELFPEHVVGLYKLAAEDLRRRADENEKNFSSQVKALTSAPASELVGEFIYMLGHEWELTELASRINFHIALDPHMPVLLERKESNATSTAVEDMKVRVQDSATKLHSDEIEKGLKFLYPALEASYFADFYDGLAAQMEFFSKIVEATYERVNVEGGPDLEAELQRIYEPLPNLAAGAGYFDIHTNPATATGGYQRAHEAIERRLDQWVQSLSSLQKISEGFGIYDLAADIGSNLKGLFTLEALKNLVIFFGVMVAIQFIPFGNIIADIIMEALFGVALLKMIVIFSSYFNAASSAKTFMQLYESTRELQEAGAAVVDVAVQLATFGVGKAIGRFLKARGRRFKSAEDLKNDPIIKELPPEKRAEFEKLLGENKQFTGWKEKLNPKTQDMLAKNPELAKVFAEMDPLARDLLTLCESPCVPETATATQGARLQAVLSKLKIAKGTEAFEYLREYLHNARNRANLDPVIKELEGLETKADLQAKIEEFIQKSAQAKGLTAVRRPDGVWEVTLENGVKVAEYQVQPHNKAPGTKSFFQSHHGIQGAWGRARVKGYGYDDAPTILLRDSKMGSPHQIVSSLQKAREAGIGSRTYSQERGLLQSDMKAAGVPKANADALLAASDGYFAKLYSKMQSSGTNPSILEGIFGDWQPSASGGSSGTNAPIQRSCAQCDGEEKAPSAPAVSSGLEAVKQGGSPLTASARSFFEPRFGRDFRDVRVHTGAQAAAAANAINARAFTTGRDIGFNTGEYAPDSHEGRRLLAHELTHVVQQRGTGTGTTLFAKKGDKQPPKVAPARGTYSVKKGRGASAYTYTFNADDLAQAASPWELIVRRHFRNIFPTAPSGAEAGYFKDVRERSIELGGTAKSDKDIKEYAKSVTDKTLETTIQPSLHADMLSWMKEHYPGVRPAVPMDATHALNEAGAPPLTPPPVVAGGTATTVQGREVILPGDLKAAERERTLKALSEILTGPPVAPDPSKKQSPPESIALSAHGVEMLLQIAKDPALIARVKASGPARSGGQDIEQFLETVIANEAASQARQRLGLSEPSGSPREEPIENRPVHGQIKNLTGALVTGQEARFTFEVLDDRDAFRVPLINIHWYAYPKGKPQERVNDEVTKYIPVRAQSFFDDRIFNVKFRQPGEYEIEAFVSYNFFLPAAFRLPNGVRVYTETTLAEVLNKEELRDFAGPGVTVPHSFDIGSISGPQTGTQTRGKLDARATIQSIEDRLKSAADDEKMVKDLIKAYEAERGSEAEHIVKWAKNYLETLEERRGALKKDEKGATPLGVKGVFVSREAEASSGPLSLLCYFFRTPDGYRLVLRDYTQLYEQEDYRFEAKEKTVEEAEEDTFIKQANAYPFGTLSVTFQGFDETTHKPKDTFVRFEKVTDTPEKKLKSFIYGTTVDIAVNLFAAILMLIPGLQALGLTLAIVYNTSKTLSELEDAAAKGTLTGEKIGIGLAKIALNVLPLAGRGAKLMTIAGKTFYVMEAVNVGANVLLVAHQGMSEVDKVRNGVIAQLAKVDGEIRAIERVNRSDGRLPELMERRRQLIKQGEEASSAVFLKLLAEQALVIIGQHLVMGYVSRRLSIGELQSQGLFRHEKDAPAKYDYKNGVIVGDQLKITANELERLQVRHTQNKALEPAIADPRMREQVIEALGDRPVEIRRGGATTALKQEGALSVLEIADGAQPGEILSAAKQAEGLPAQKPAKPPTKGAQPEFRKIVGEREEFVRWKEKLEPETRKLLEKNPELEKVYAEMDPLTRDLLTLCKSPCIPENATAAQGARIQAILKNLKIRKGSETFEYLREYLHNAKNRDNLDPVIQELEGLKSEAVLQTKVETFIKASATAKGLSAARRADGKWEVTLADGSTVTEYQIQAHNQAPGTRSFFQSHHGIQGAWARARVKGYVYEEASTILLRDSKMGSPHQIVSSLQKAREGTIGSRTYSQERENLLSDMKAAGVPKAEADKLLAASDNDFAKLYNKLKSGGAKAPALESIFGDWEP